MGPRRFSAARLVLLILLAGCSEGEHAPAPIPQPNPAFDPTLSRLTPGDAEGRCELSPSEFEAAEIGTYTLLCTVGPSGIVTGGGLMVELPKGWIANPFPSIKPLQLKSASRPHFLSASCSRAGCALAVKKDSQSFAGKRERFRRTITLTLKSGALLEGDRVEVTLANTTAPDFAGPDEIRVAVDQGGSGEFRLIQEAARYQVVSGPPREIRLTAPSQAVVGETVELQITALDRFFNLAADLPEDLAVEVVGSRSLQPRRAEESKGVATAAWTPEQEGFYWFSATGAWSDAADEEVRGQRVVAPGGPVRVHERKPQRQLYWGDLHVHSRISPDGIGHGAFEYARDVTRLDFLASTEHSDDDSGEQDGISPEEWEGIRSQAHDLYEPGRFVTLLGYECSLRRGHHNVIFRSLDGVPWPAHAVGLVENLWKQLRTGQAITIPHHLGLNLGTMRRRAEGPGQQRLHPPSRYFVRPAVFDWRRPHSRKLRPALEIYSSHGNSEHFAPDDPLAYENVRFVNGRSTRGPHYARDAWARGHRMGVVAASDNHSAHPGQHHLGLTAVFAKDLTREAIFDALFGRRSYGSTGQRIYLEFDVGGWSMGKSRKVRSEVQGSVLVAAPVEIQFAEVLSLGAGESEWRVAARWERPGKLLSAKFKDKPSARGATYYLRTELIGEFNGRLARAWSSPVWLKP